jgi:SAM-dependent methyltransferase
VREFSLPTSDEPFDFRRQASIYARWRRDYSPALYDAIEARAGRGAGRAVLDLGCGPGLVAATLAARGWRPVGVDFSAPMLEEAARDGATSFARARAEALPLRPGSVALVTCGTAFHWFAPAPTLAEIERVLLPGGWAAVFWRYEVPGQPYMRLVGEVLREFTPGAFVLGEDFTVHPPEPFADSGLSPAPALTIDAELAFTPESFHGYIATLEWVRRFVPDRHGEFLARLGAELARRSPDGFRERTQEHLFLAEKRSAS